MRLFLLTLLATAQDASVLKPGTPRAERAGDRWKLSLATSAELPDGAVLSIRIRGVTLRYNEIGRSLETREAAVGPTALRAIVEGRKATIRATAPAYRNLSVEWSVDRNAQTRGAVIEKDVPPARQVWLPGTPAERWKAIRLGLAEPVRLHDKLLELLKQLDGKERPTDAWSSAIAALRDRCALETNFTASVGLLDSVAGDAAAYASWRRYGAKRKGSNSGSNDSGNSQNDGSEGQTGGSSSPEGRTDNFDINKISSAGLIARLEVFPKVLRAEMLLLLDAEALELIESALSGKTVEPSVASDFAALVESVSARIPEDKESVLPLHAALRALRSTNSGERSEARESLRSRESGLRKLP